MGYASRPDRDPIATRCRPDGVGLGYSFASNHLAVM